MLFLISLNLDMELQLLILDAIKCKYILLCYFNN